jgi:hypothetical protein
VLSVLGEGGVRTEVPNENIVKIVRYLKQLKVIVDAYNAISVNKSTVDTADIQRNVDFLETMMKSPPREWTEYHH